jgi:hypothetical protein
MTTRDRAVVIGVVLVAVLAAYWFLLLAPKRAHVHDLESQITTQQQHLASSLHRLRSGEAARRQYATNYATVARLGQAVPADDNLPSLVYQLDVAAGASKVDFRGVKLSPAGAAAATPTPPASGSPSAPASQGAAATLPPGATVGPAGFPTMPFSLSFDGSFFHMANFLGQLERFVRTTPRTVRVGGRLLTVDGFALTASRAGFPRVKASISATAYLVAPSQGGTGGASPSGPGSPASGSSTASSPPPAAIAPPPVR